MSMRSLVFVVAGMAIAPGLAAAQLGAEAARPIALADAVRLAQINSPTTVAARNALRTGEASVRQSLMQYLPTLNLSYTSTQAGGTQFVGGTAVPAQGFPWTYSRGLNSQLTIFDGGQRWYNYRAADAGLDASLATEVTQRYVVALGVKQQYYAILAARESDAAAQRQLEQAQQNLKVAAAKMAAGAATRADSLQAAVGVGNAKLAILTAENLVLNANAALTRLVASPITVTAVESDTSTGARIDLSTDSLSRLVTEGPAVQQAALALVAAKAGHKAQTTPYLPTLAATASYGQNPKGSQGFDWGTGPATTRTSLGFSMSYTVFDNYKREQSLVTARVAEDNADAQYRDQKFLAQQNLTQQLANFRTAEQKIELQLLTIQQSDEALRVVQQRYNLGTAALLEVLTAQTALDNARAALIQARLDARTAKANIEALIGRDLP
jgi:outer membrane protein